MKVNNKVLLGLGLALIALVAVSFVYHFEEGHKTWRYRSTYVTWPQGSEYGYRSVVSLAPVDVNVVDSSGEPKELWGYFVTLEGVDGQVYVGFTTPTSTSVGRYGDIYMVIGARNLSDNRAGVWFLKRNDQHVYYAEVSLDGDSSGVMGALASADAQPVGTFALSPDVYDSIRSISAYPVGNDLVIEWALGTSSAPYSAVVIPGAADLGSASPTAQSRSLFGDAQAFAIADASDRIVTVFSVGMPGELSLIESDYSKDTYEQVYYRVFPSFPGVYGPFAIYPAVVVQGGNPTYIYAVVQGSGELLIFRMPYAGGEWEQVGSIPDMGLYQAQAYSGDGVAYLVAKYSRPSDGEVGIIVLRFTADGWGQGGFTETREGAESMATVAFYPVIDRGGVPAAWQTPVFAQYGSDAIHFAYIAVESPYSVYDVNSLTVPYWTPDNDVNIALHVRGAAIGASEITQYFVVSIWDENYYHNWRFFVPVTFPESNSLADRTVYIVSKLTAGNAYYAQEGKPVDPSVKYKISVYTVDNVPTAWEYESEYHTYYDTGWFYPADIAESREIPPQNEGGSGTGGGSGVVQVSRAPRHEEYFVQPASPVASPSVPPSFVVAVLVAVLVIGSLAAKAR